MKFIHTADWQLGMAFGHIHEKAEALRQARIDAVKQVIALAEKEAVDFVLAAGDLFDDNRIAPVIVEEAARILKSSSIPIYLLPGNHDPLTQDSPYVRCPGLFVGSAIVLRDEAPVTIPGGTLYPCPALSRNSTHDPTRRIPARTKTDGIRIGIAHGSIGTPSPNDYPISVKASIEKQLDYLALGHWHGVKKIDERTWYCGAPEATAFGQPNAGKALMVEIASPEATPVVKEVTLAQYHWKEIDRELHSEAELQALLKEVQVLANANVLLRLRLKGSLSQTCLDQIDQINRERFFHVKIDNELQVHNGVHEYRHPLLHEMSESLMKKANGEDQEQAEIARLALSKLRLLVKHAGFTGEETKK
jgi:DNA repair exonuclease SbcCD nuclease subunit